jgi:hypothetical protein
MPTLWWQLDKANPYCKPFSVNVINFLDTNKCMMFRRQATDDKWARSYKMEYDITCI